MTSEPLFDIENDVHHAFVRVVELPWPLAGCALEGKCRSCDWRSEKLRAFYESAMIDCYNHTQAMAMDRGASVVFDVPNEAGML